MCVCVHCFPPFCILFFTNPDYSCKNWKRELSFFLARIARDWLMWGRRSAVYPGVNVLQFFLKGRKEGERHCRAQWWGVWMEWRRGKRRRRRMRTTTITSPSLFLVSTRWLNNFMIAAKGKKGCVHSSSTIIMERERERVSWHPWWWAM